MNPLELAAAVASFAGGPIGLIAKAASIAPSLMKYVGAGESAQRIAETIANVAIGLTGDKDPGNALNIIQQDPHKVMDFQLKLAEHDLAMDKLYIEDMQNARQRDLELHKAGYVNKRANFLVAFALTTVILIIVFIVWKSPLDEFVKATITLILGRVLGYIDNIFNFEFGTSRASQKKDETINNLTKPTNG